MERDELPREEAERRAKEVARILLTTPKPPRPPPKREGQAATKRYERMAKRTDDKSI